MPKSRPPDPAEFRAQMVAWGDRELRLCFGARSAKRSSVKLERSEGNSPPRGRDSNGSRSSMRPFRTTLFRRGGHLPT